MRHYGGHEKYEHGIGAQESLLRSSSPSHTSTGILIRELSSMSDVVVADAQGNRRNRDGRATVFNHFMTSRKSISVIRCALIIIQC